MNLHWWNTGRLVRDLARDAVSDRDGSRYMMVAGLLYMAALYQALWFGAPRNWAFFFEIVFVAFITLIGVHECYKANGGSNGTDFVARFSMLTVPVGVKLAVLGLILGQGVYYAAPHVLQTSQFRDPSIVYRYISFIMPVGFAFVYYWRIVVHLREVRRLREAGREVAL